MNTLTLSQQEIALRAYHIYLDGGCPNGHDWDHWFQAEQELGAKFFTPPAAKAPVSASSGGAALAAKKAAPAAKAVPAAKKAAKKEAAKKVTAKKTAPKK
jgi:nucleoid-associated protein YgaU